MKKVKLRIESLEIESFDTALPARHEEGTVLGFATKPHQNTCGGQDTCANTCGWVNTCMVADCGPSLEQSCVGGSCYC